MEKMGMIIIKNYGMPHNCYDCDLHNYHECDLTSESIEEDYCWNGDSREKHCPLREVEAIPEDEYEPRMQRSEAVNIVKTYNLEEPNLLIAINRLLYDAEKLNKIEQIVKAIL